MILYFREESAVSFEIVHFERHVRAEDWGSRR